MFPTPFTPFFQKTWSFLPKIAYLILVGNRQTKTFKKKLNVWVFEMILHTLAVPKASNWNKLWLFKHTPMMGEILVFFQKKAVI